MRFNKDIVHEPPLRKNCIRVHDILAYFTLGYEEHQKFFKLACLIRIAMRKLIIHNPIWIDIVICLN
jgi:hypothetical protein